MRNGAVLPVLMLLASGGCAAAKRTARCDAAECSAMQWRAGMERCGAVRATG